MRDDLIKKASDNLSMYVNVSSLLLKDPLEREINRSKIKINLSSSSAKSTILNDSISDEIVNLFDRSSINSIPIPTALPNGSRVRLT